MERVNIIDLHQSLSKTIEKAIEDNETIVIETNNGKAVIVPEAIFKSITETIYLESQPSLLDKIKSGEKENIDSLTLYNESEEW